MADYEAKLRRRLLTPEGLDLGVVLGDGGQRATAFLIDLMIIFLALILLVFFVVFGVFSLLRMRRPDAAAEALFIIGLLGWFVLRNGYFIGFELRGRSATPGKRIMGLRVIARDGGRLTADAVIARNLMREIEFYLPLSFLVARAAEGTTDGWINLLGLGWTGIFLLFPLFNRDRLRIGDLLAGTWVIRARREALASDLGVRAEVARVRLSFTKEQLAVYGEYELQTLERVLRQDNHEAIEAVAAAIVQRIGWPDRIDGSREFLTEFYAALRPQLERRMLFGRRKADKTAA